MLSRWSKTFVSGSLRLQVRAISPYLGPPSDLTVVKMIPNERLPPRNLHCVRAEKTQAMLKWQPPYDSPSAPLVGNGIGKRNETFNQTETKLIFNSLEWTQAGTDQ